MENQFENSPGKVRAPKFDVDPVMDKLVAEYRTLSKTGTGISLDPEGYTQEQITDFETSLTTFVSEHGDKLLSYLEPYDKIGPNGQQLTGNDFERWITIKSLKQYEGTSERG